MPRMDVSNRWKAVALPSNGFSEEIARLTAPSGQA